MNIERVLQEKRERLRRVVQAAGLPVVRSIVEMAAGDGSLSVVLKEMFPDAAVTAVDRKVEFLRGYISEHGIDIKLVQGDIADPVGVDVEVDLVCYSNVVRHVSRETFAKSLKAASGLLGEGGLCLVIDRDEEARSKAQELRRRVHEVEIEIGRLKGEEPEIGCGRDEIEELIGKAGMRVTYSRVHPEEVSRVDECAWAEWREELMESVASLAEAEREDLAARIREIDEAYRKVGLETFALCVMVGRNLVRS